MYNRTCRCISAVSAFALFLLIIPSLQAQMQCPFPPPSPVIIDVCEGESTLIDLTSQVMSSPVLVWSETFDEDGAGVAGACTGPDPSTCATNNPPMNGQWSVSGDVSGLTATSDFFQVMGGRLDAQDLDIEVCFLSEVIDISANSSVDFSILIEETGDHEALDYVDVTLIIDGVPSLIPNWMGQGDASHTLIDDFTSTTITQAGITGNTVQIQICLLNNAGTEDIYLDNITLTDNSSTTSFNFYDGDPSMGMPNLLASMVNTYDPMTTVGTSPQSVWVTTTDGMCETSAIEMTVTVRDAPTVIASAVNTAICDGEDIMLLETGMEADTWLWSGPGGYSSMDQNPIIMGATAAEAGMYRVRGTNSMTMCTDSADVVITVGGGIPPTAVNINACEGESTLIDLSSQATIMYSQVYLLDFETPGGYTTDRPEYTDGGGDFFTRTDGSNIGGFVNYSNVQGSFYFAGMDLDADAQMNPGTININGIDITGNSDLELSVFLAEDDNGTDQNWDEPDFVHIEYQIDGGGFQNLLWVENDGSTFNSAPFIDTDFDGTGDGTEITDVFTEFTASIAGTGSTLDLRIVISLDSGDEDIAIDNILVRNIEGMTSFNFYDMDPSMGMPAPVASMVTEYDPMTTVATSPQSIWVTSTDGTCESTATEMTVTVIAGPIVVASAISTEVCIGDDIALMEMGMEADSWLWSGPNGFSSMMQNPTIMGVTSAEAGTYRVRGMNAATGCIDSSDVVITVYPIPSPPVVADGAFCEAAEILIAPSPGPFPACDLIISEYIEGSFSNKCIEIYNGSGTTIDLSNYSIRLYTNGSPTVSNSFTMSGMLNDGEVHVVCNSGAAPEFLAEADETNNGAINWNGDDAVALANNGVNIDIIGEIGFDPGGSWNMNGVSTSNQTIIRSEAVICGDNDGSNAFDPSAEFISLGQDVATNLGMHTYNGMSPDPVLYNFYDADPAGGMANLLGGPAATFNPGMEGTFYVTSVINGCESTAVPVVVVVSLGEQPLYCNDHINMSLGNDCELEVTADMILEGAGAMAEFLTVELLDPSGNVIPGAILNESHVGLTFTVKVIDICNSNSCWGTLSLEDKLGPVFPEFCPQNDPCELTCDTALETILLNVNGFLDGSITDCSPFDLTGPTTETRKAIECTDPDTLVLTYTAIDIWGSKTVKQYFYVFTPIDLNNVVFPPNYPGTCETDPIPSITGSPTVDGLEIKFASDNTSQLCNILVSYTDNVLPACGGDCDNSRKIIREWTLLDWCSSEILPGSQIIHLKDEERPTIDPFERLTASVDPWTCQVDRYLLPDMMANDNCAASEDLEVIINGPVGVEIKLEADGNYYAYHLPKGRNVFEYYAKDCCGNISLVQPFFLTVVDEVKPVAIAKQFTVVSLSNIEGEDDGIAKIFAKDIDNGSYDWCTDVKLEIRRDGNYGKRGANESDYLRWDRDFPPFPGFPGPYAEYPCDVAGNDTYNDDGHSWDMPNGLNFNSDPDDGQYVKFCCYDLSAATVDVNNDGTLDAGYVKVWLRVWDNADMTLDDEGNPTYGTADDNFNETWAYVKVEVSSPPELEVTHTTISCDWPYDEKLAEGYFLENEWVDQYISTTGICDVELSVTIDETNVDPVCPQGYFELIYTATNKDSKGLAVVKRQRVTIDDFDSRITCSDINWPESYAETDCMDLEDFDLTWNGGSCDLIGWTMRSDTFNFESGSCSKIINNYTLIDWCAFDAYHNSNTSPLPFNTGFFEGGNDYYDGILCQDPDYGPVDNRVSPTGVYQYVEVIKLVDDIAPEILLCDYDPFPIADKCSRTVTVSNIAVDNSVCPESWLTWELTLTTEDGDVYIYRKRSKSGEVINIDLVDDLGDPLDFYGPMSTHDLKWIVSDGCGNVDKCVTTFMVVDRKDPTPYCVSLSSAVMVNGQVELWARDFNVSSFDNCSAEEDLRYTFDQILPVFDLLDEEHYFDGNGLVDDEEEIAIRYANGEIQLWNPDQRSSARVFTCANLPSTTFDMSVWDEKFNMDYCKVTLDLSDNQNACGPLPIADIGGTITTKYGAGINRVDVLLENATEGSQISTQTNSLGQYLFEHMPMEASYNVIPSKKGDLTDGLSTEDVLLIQKYIMDNSLFTSPYDVIASDLNNDKRISATDIILLQRIVIGQLTELKDGIWKFVDADQELSLENALRDFRNTFAIPNLQNSLMSTDFIGVKMGDVTGDASTNARQDTEGSRSRHSTTAYIFDREVRKGDIIDVPVYFQDFEDLVGYQMTISLSYAEAIDVEGLSTPLYASNKRLASENEIALSYGDIRAALNSGDVYSIKLKANKSGWLSDLIKITNNLVVSEAYYSIDIVPEDIELEFRTNEFVAADFTIEQNVPNPFHTSTYISISLPEAGDVQLSVYNVTGQLVYSMRGNYPQGMSNVELRSNEMNGYSGVLYYKATYNNRSITKKMILIE